MVRGVLHALAEVARVTVTAKVRWVDTVLLVVNFTSGRAGGFHLLEDLLDGNGSGLAQWVALVIGSFQCFQILLERRQICYIGWQGAHRTLNRRDFIRIKSTRFVVSDHLATNTRNLRTKCRRLLGIPATVRIKLLRRGICGAFG